MNTEKEKLARMLYGQGVDVLASEIATVDDYDGMSLLRGVEVDKPYLWWTTKIESVCKYFILISQDSVSDCVKYGFTIHPDKYNNLFYIVVANSHE